MCWPPFSVRCFIPGRQHSHLAYPPRFRFRHGSGPARPNEIPVSIRARWRLSYFFQLWHEAHILHTLSETLRSSSGRSSFRGSYTRRDTRPGCDCLWPNHHHHHHHRYLPVATKFLPYSAWWACLTCQDPDPALQNEVAHDGWTAQDGCDGAVEYLRLAPLSLSSSLSLSAAIVGSLPNIRSDHEKLSPDRVHYHNHLFMWTELMNFLIHCTTAPLRHPKIPRPHGGTLFAVPSPVGPSGLEMAFAFAQSL